MRLRVGLLGLAVLGAVAFGGLEVEAWFGLVGGVGLPHEADRAPTATQAGLPAAARRGRLRAVSNTMRGLWMDTGAQWFNLNGKVVNGQDYGMVGDGVADDTAALALAVAAAAAAGSGAVLYLPAGTYKLTSETVLNTLTGLTIRGAVGRTVLSVATAGSFTWTNNLSGVLRLTGCTSVTLEGFSIEADATEHTPTGGGNGTFAGLYITGSSRVSVRDVLISDLHSDGTPKLNGMVLNAAAYCTFERVRVEHCDVGAYVNSCNDLYWEHCLISNNQGVFGAGGGETWFINDNTRFLFVECVFDEGGTVGNRWDGSGNTEICYQRCLFYAQADGLVMDVNVASLAMLDCTVEPFGPATNASGIRVRSGATVRFVLGEVTGNGTGYALQVDAGGVVSASEVAFTGTVTNNGTLRRMDGSNVYSHTHQTAAQGGKVDHGAGLTGLADDDHTQYVHVSEARTISASHLYSIRQVLANNIALAGKDTGGTAYDFAMVSSGDQVLLGSASLPLGLLGTTFGAYGVTPVARPAAYTQTFATASRVHPAAAQAAVDDTAATNVTPWGYTSQAQADALRAAVNNARTDIDAVKKLLNQVIDDLQSQGLLQ